MKFKKNFFPDGRSIQIKLFVKLVNVSNKNIGTDIDHACVRS